MHNLSAISRLHFSISSLYIFDYFYSKYFLFWYPRNIIKDPASHLDPLVPAQYTSPLHNLILLSKISSTNSSYGDGLSG